MTGITDRAPRPVSESALVLPQYLRESPDRRTPLDHAGYRSTALRAAAHPGRPAPPAHAAGSTTATATWCLTR